MIKLHLLLVWLLLVAQAARSMPGGESSGSGLYGQPSLSWRKSQTDPILPSISDAFPGHGSSSRSSPAHFSPLSSPSRSHIRTQPPSPKSGGPASPVLLVLPPQGKKMGWFKNEINKQKLIRDPLVHTAWARVRENVVSSGGTGVFWNKPREKVVSSGGTGVFWKKPRERVQRNGGTGHFWNKHREKVQRSAGTGVFWKKPE